MLSYKNETGSEVSTEKDVTIIDDKSLSLESTSDQLPSMIASTATFPASIPDAEHPFGSSNLRRRGLFHHLVVIHSIEDPRQYDRKLKWFITLIVATAAVIDPLGSNIFYRTLSILHSIT